MRIAYSNAFYRPDSSSGANAHIGQFISNTVAMRHELWAWPGAQHPDLRYVPQNRLTRLMHMRRMDVLYVRVEYEPPGQARWAVAPWRQLVGNPVVVWEFNALPEFGRIIGRSDDEIRRAIHLFRRYGRGCDLAVCVSKAMVDYVRDRLGIPNVLVVPNGSDPELFRPGLIPVPRLQYESSALNVVWIGSADLAWHGFDLLRGAAELLWKHDRRTEVVFHLIGQGFSSIGDMPPNVNYYGAQSYKVLPRWLAAMDVGLVLYRSGPSDYSSPLKLFDYMASGLTVVSSHQPQVREVFEQLQQTDLLVANDDPDALAQTLLSLATDRDRVRKQGELGRQLVIDHYNWRRAVRDTLSEIAMLLESRRRSSGR